MAIKVFCEGCNKTYNVQDTMAGKRGKCPAGHLIAVPTSSIPNPALPSPSSPFVSLNLPASSTSTSDSSGPGSIPAVFETSPYPVAPVLQPSSDLAVVPINLPPPQPSKSVTEDSPTAAALPTTNAVAIDTPNSRSASIAACPRRIRVFSVLIGAWGDLFGHFVDVAGNSFYCIIWFLGAVFTVGWMCPPLSWFIYLGIAGVLEENTALLIRGNSLNKVWKGIRENLIIPKSRGSGFVLQALILGFALFVGMFAAFGAVYVMDVMLGFSARVPMVQTNDDQPHRTDSSLGMIVILVSFAVGLLPVIYLHARLAYMPVVAQQESVWKATRPFVLPLIIITVVKWIVVGISIFPLYGVPLCVTLPYCAAVNERVRKAIDDGQ